MKWHQKSACSRPDTHKAFGVFIPAQGPIFSVTSVRSVVNLFPGVGASAYSSLRGNSRARCTRSRLPWRPTSFQAMTMA